MSTPRGQSQGLPRGCLIGGFQRACFPFNSLRTTLPPLSLPPPLRLFARPPQLRPLEGGAPLPFAPGFRLVPLPLHLRPPHGAPIPYSYSMRRSSTLALLFFSEDYGDPALCQAVESTESRLKIGTVWSTSWLRPAAPNTHRTVGAEQDSLTLRPLNHDQRLTIGAFPGERGNLAWVEQCFLGHLSPH